MMRACYALANPPWPPTTADTRIAPHLRVRLKVAETANACEGVVRKGRVTLRQETSSRTQGPPQVASTRKER
jgi:hypothetical protein